MDILLGKIFYTESLPVIISPEIHVDQDYKKESVEQNKQKPRAPAEPLRVERHRIRMDEAMGDRRCKRQSQWSRRQNDWSGPGSGGGGSACLRQGTAILAWAAAASLVMLGIVTPSTATIHLANLTLPAGHSVKALVHVPKDRYGYTFLDCKPCDVGFEYDTPCNGSQQQTCKPCDPGFVQEFVTVNVKCVPCRQALPPIGGCPKDHKWWNCTGTRQAQCIHTLCDDGFYAPNDTSLQGFHKSICTKCSAPCQARGLYQVGDCIYEDYKCSYFPVQNLARTSEPASVTSHASPSVPPVTTTTSEEVVSTNATMSTPPQPPCTPLHGWTKENSASSSSEHVPSEAAVNNEHSWTPTEKALTAVCCTMATVIVGLVIFIIAQWRTNKKKKDGRQTGQADELEGTVPSAQSVSQSMFRETLEAGNIQELGAQYQEGTTAQEDFPREETQAAGDLPGPAINRRTNTRMNTGVPSQPHHPSSARVVVPVYESDIPTSSGEMTTDSEADRASETPDDDPLPRDSPVPGLRSYQGDAQGATTLTGARTAPQNVPIQNTAV
ncbi:uncharacterized protein LOC135825016 isoform X2 [Sycon ciliatum]|uniref:uncharacterized protein LOC135825016 isoform X2 n=1 Tax=Sycon ciliatum TaxID=27933 RepID=UPI0031F6ED55